LIQVAYKLIANLTAITDSGSTNIHVPTTGENTENVTVIACCNAAGKFLPLF
jgi:hypothetical protein